MGRPLFFVGPIAPPRYGEMDTDAEGGLRFPLASNATT
jgi:hypothetical protein